MRQSIGGRRLIRTCLWDQCLGKEGSKSGKSLNGLRTKDCLPPEHLGAATKKT